jgi:hypothetical protein
MATKKTAAIDQPSEKESLAKELKSLIPKLDEEGLAFLVKQAQVHLYNMQVDVLNQTIINDNQRKKSSAKVSKETVKKTGFSDVKISGSGSHILYGNQWISFSNSEITSLVRIAKGEGTDLEIRERIYNWLKRERSDLLMTASIADKFNDDLKSLITLLKKNFELKK